LGHDGIDALMERGGCDVWVWVDSVEEKLAQGRAV
jgi:hypothetical protein